MQHSWHYLVYLAAGAALILLFARRRGRAGNRGQGLVALAIFLVLGILLLVMTLSRTTGGTG